jgi:hypothetical protein
MLRTLSFEVETEGKCGPSSGSMVKVWFRQIGDVKRSWPPPRFQCTVNIWIQIGARLES